MDTAAKAGHLPIVKWLHQNRTEGCSNAALDSAVRERNLEMVTWLVENRKEVLGSKFACPIATKFGFHEIVEFLKRNHFE